MEALRRICANLARLRHDFNDSEVGDDPWFKLDKTLPEEALDPLRPTYVPIERAAMLGAVRVIVDYYGGLAAPLAEEHNIDYPTKLDGLMLARLNKLG